MRVSTNMLSYNFMTSLNSALERQNNLQEKLADGKDLHRPSDDPVKTIRSLRFNINLRENEQYTQNVKDALSWMETTDGAMSDLSSLTIKAKELVTNAIAPNPNMALDAIAKELDGIINQMVQIGNTRIGDRYIFAGQKDKTEPFKREILEDANGNKIETVTYSGDSNKISMRIQPGSMTPSQDSVNLTGEEVFGSLKTVTTKDGTQLKTADLFNNLLAIKRSLEGKQSQSNPTGGQLTLDSGSPGSPDKAFILKIDNVAGGLPQSPVSYSIDGGETWNNAAIDATGQITFPAGTLNKTSAVVYNVASSPNTAKGDTYTIPTTADGGASCSSNLKWLSNVGMDLVDKVHDQILNTQTEIGARMSMYEQAQSLLERDNVVITGDVSANEDLDIPKAMVDFKTSESIYRTALSIGARLMPPSLADFLK
ncbi:hypothetical protein SRRS_39870 [Sporomusa rhizae]|uniref:flagellar hook-associated protein FlgL n=1 Tax=Sporomusa rhizae TaxID=357999 RepID=UPI00352AA665